MIKYSPVRRTLSASIKEEQVFDTVEEMKQYIFDWWGRILVRRPLKPEDIIIEESGSNDLRIGYKNRRTVFIRQSAVGFCGE